MRRSLDQYLEDILKALSELEGFLQGVTFEEYKSKPLIFRATEREFTIIWEAIRQMEHHFPEVHKRIESIRGIADFRNFIIHEYSHVDDAVIWETATYDAPVLRAQVQNWKDEMNTSSPQ